MGRNTQASIPDGGRAAPLIHASTLLMLLCSIATPARSAEEPRLCFGEIPTIVGTRGPDRIEGTDGNDVIVGLAGNDEIESGSGEGVVCGGSGSDAIGGELEIVDGTDRLSGGLGPDYIAGDLGNDILNGGRERDNLFDWNGQQDSTLTSGGRDAIDGGPGNDRIGGGYEADRMRGGAGLDLVYFYVAGQGGVTADLRSGEADGDGGHEIVEGFEGVVGTHSVDVIYGNERPNYFDAEGGNDEFHGRRGNDFYREYGYGARRNDSFYGGPGQDTFYFNPEAFRSVDADLAAGSATGHGSDVLEGVENLTGGVGKDILRGDRGPNILLGGYNGRPDRIVGRRGNDKLSGGGPRRGDGDVIRAGAGSDVCEGGDRVFGCETPYRVRWPLWPGFERNRS